MALGPRLTALSLSIGSNPQTCRLTDAGIASALLACSELRHLSLDVGRNHRMDNILSSWLSTLGDDAEARPALTQLEVAGHYLGNAVELCFPPAFPGDNASLHPGPKRMTPAGLAWSKRLNTRLLRVLSLHEREWNAEATTAEAGAEPPQERPRRLLLMDRYIKCFLRPGVVPALEELTVKAPLGDNLTQSDIGLLATAGGKQSNADKDQSEPGRLRKLSLTNNGHSDTQSATSYWTDDLALMTIALGQQQLQSLELSGFRLRITTATLVEVMSNCAQITELSLPRAHQIESAQAVNALVFAEHGGSSVLRNGPALRFLSCNGWPLDSRSLCMLLEQSAAKDLERLHLAGCGGANDVSLLMLALNCRSLTSLVLSGVHISDTGLQHIVGAVFTPRLVELSLYGCRQVKSPDVLCELCSVLVSIESLSLGHMQCVTDKVIEVLAMQQLVSSADGGSDGRLRKLRLDYCKTLTARCLGNIGRLVKIHQLSIRSVGFLYTCLTPASRKGLACGLEALASGTPNLRRLQISHALGTRYSNIHAVDAWMDEDERKLVEELASVAVWLKFMVDRPEVMVTEIVDGHNLQLVVIENRIRRDRRL